MCVFGSPCYNCFIVDNVKVSPDGSVLTISSAQPVNHGAYRCVASNPYGVTHSVASLIVRGMIIDSYFKLLEVLNLLEMVKYLRHFKISVTKEHY